SGRRVGHRLAGVDEWYVDLTIDDVPVAAGVGFRSDDSDSIANVLFLWNDNATSVMYVDDMAGYLR
ncbi:hypothetical protein ACFL6U_31475, partial [Planctomycetota bacterium]